MSKKIPGIRLVITDLDNTLYDWYKSFVPAFYAMVGVATEILAVDKEQLLDELKQVHVRYHNSEQPFALLETPSVERKFPNATQLERKYLLDKAFRTFSEVRKKNLHLFPGVRATLANIREKGCIVVGHTEAVVANSLYRLKILDLIPAFDRLYAPASSSPGHPDSSRRELHEVYSTFVSLLATDHRKPDRVVLEDICSHFNVPVSRVLYVGDSLTRDISMAAMAGTHSAFAAYGGKCSREMWAQLVRITHWTERDVKLEERLREEFADLKPDAELSSFADLLQYFEFEGGPITRVAVANE
jgi:phosphoglycolate phosphatase